MGMHNTGVGGLMTAVVMSVAVACPSLAQVQSGQSGRALDANPQVGSGGVNRPGEVIDFAVRNAVITGNVPGGREFRGDVGYSAPTEFRGQAGSDDLFNFNARSIGSSLPVATSGMRYDIDPSTVVVPRATGAAGYYSSSELLVPNRLVAPTGGTYNAAQIASGTATIIIPDASRYAVRDETDGRMMEVSVTPLLGVRELEPVRVRQPGEDLTDLSQRTQYQLDAEIKPETTDQLETQPTPTQPMDQQVESGQMTTMVDPGLSLGQQLTAYRMGVDSRTFDQQVADIERTMFRQLGSRNANPGDDVYLDVLRSMRGDAPTKAVVAEPTQPLPELEAPTIEELEKAEAERRRAVEAAAAALAEYQQRQAPSEEQPDVQPVAPAPSDEADRGDTAAMPESLGGLLDTLGEAQDLPRLVTLAGEREDRINRLMRDAEADMVAEKFFDAEAKYRQVLQDAPDSPLAVAGQVHAQLGAAMIKSAAFNLRRLFTQHPELIGVRYDPKLLPPQKRLDFVHGQIMQELRDAPRAETALTLAYLGYQINSRQLVRYGLAIAEARSPQDPLLPLLRRIWLSDSHGKEAARSSLQGSQPPDVAR